MPVRHVIRTEPADDDRIDPVVKDRREPVNNDIDMIYGDEEYEYEDASDSDYVPSDEEDDLDDEFIPRRLSARRTRKSAQGRAEVDPDESRIEDSSEIHDEMELDIRERSSLPTLPATLPQEIKDVLTLVAVKQGSLAGGELQQIVLDYIQNSMDPIVLQLIADVLALAPENIISGVANSVAQIVYNCWINRTEPFMLGEVLSIQQTHDDNQLISFLENLDDGFVEALFTRTDW